MFSPLETKRRFFLLYPSQKDFVIYPFYAYAYESIKKRLIDTTRARQYYKE